MKNSDELKQKRYALMTELKNLGTTGLDQRKMEARESELSNEIHELSGQILAAEISEENALNDAMRNAKVISRGNMETDKYSFVKAIREMAEGHLTGVELEMHQEAKREASNIGQSIRGFGIPSIVLNRASSGQNFTTNADGGFLAGTGGQMNFFEALKNKLTLAQLGATFLTGLQGKLPLVGGSAFTAAFALEGGEISKTKAAFTDRGTLTPRRLGALGAISKELIYQSSVDVEKIIVNELVSAIAQAIETAAINGSGEAPNPTGILNTANVKAVTIGDNGGAITWAKVVELETAVKAANGHGLKMGYLTNSSVLGALKTIPKVSGGEKFLMENNLLNGYSCLDTNAVPSDLDKGTSTGVCSAMIFAAWESLIIGQWGGLDLIVDPYTRKAFGEIELNTTQFIDIGVSNPYQFGMVKDIVTA